jgi:tetratricopeptide (TPR) repeat protein
MAGHDIWEWIHKDENRLRKEGGSKAAMADRFDEFFHHYQYDFTTANAIINEALDIARSSGELRWELLIRHWRLQLWLNDDLHRVLPEAIDLLSLATDERVRDVPQRICAMHDLVDCYVQMDAAGHYDDIVANVEHVLALLPKVHNCADCARLNMAQSAAAAGKTDVADHWLAQLESNIKQKTTWNERFTGIGNAYEEQQRWAQALAAYQKATKAKSPRLYVEGMLGVARAYIGLGNTHDAMNALQDARHGTKYFAGTYLLARLMEVEGYMAEALGEPAIALDYFTRATQQHFDQARYRHCAITGIHAVEMARNSGLEAESADILDIIARAIGNMPENSYDMRSRLGALGKLPIEPPPTTHSIAFDTPSDEAGQERATLDDALHTHIRSGNLPAIALFLYRLGHWYATHDQPRAAVDYLILNAVMERIQRLSMDDREDALNGLSSLQERLPEGTLEAAFAAAESGPPEWLSPLFKSMPPARWRWLVRSVAAQVLDGVAIEPEPDIEEEGFDTWIEHIAEMNALLLRFPDHVTPVERERWAQGITETADHLRQTIEQDESESKADGGKLLQFIDTLAMMVRSATGEYSIPPLGEPFDQIIQQIQTISQRPIWQHPGNYPFEFMIEKASQEAVRALRIQDEHRESRLANRDLRYRLMAIDLKKEKEISELGDFLEVLAEIMRDTGCQIPARASKLDPGLAQILAAVVKAGKVSA